MAYLGSDRFTSLWLYDRLVSKSKPNYRRKEKKVEKAKEKTLSVAAIEARRAYNREYYRKHREKAKQYKLAYWERKAAQIQATAGEEKEEQRIDRDHQ